MALLPGATGYLVSAASPSTPLTHTTLTVEPRQSGIGFRVAGAPGCLRILPSLAVDFAGGTGPFASWEVVSQGGHFALRVLGIQEPTFLAWKPPQPAAAGAAPNPGGNFMTNLLIAARGPSRQQQQQQQQSRGFFATQKPPGSPDTLFFFSPIVTGTLVQPGSPSAKPDPLSPAPLPPSSSPNPAAAAVAPAVAALAKKMQQQHAVPVPERHVLVDPASLPRDDDADQDEGGGAPSLNWQDGDCVHLVSTQHFLALPLRLTVETASFQHLTLLWEQVQQQQQQQQHQLDPSPNGIMMSKLRQQQQQQQQSIARTDEESSSAAANSNVCVVGFDVHKQKQQQHQAQHGLNHLRILHNRSIDTAGGKGPWALFEVTRTRAGVLLRCLGHPQPTFLAAVKDQGGGALVLGAVQTDATAPDERCLWMLQPAKSLGIFAPGRFIQDRNAFDVDVAGFVQRGFVVIKGAVREELVTGALRYLNHLLGTGPAAWQPDPKTPGKFVIPHSSHRAVISPFRCSDRVATASQILCGRSNVASLNAVQLALRFPVFDEMVDEISSNPNDNRQNWHIDGMDSTATVPFSLLGYAALSDQPRDHGNFTVFPGCHRRRDVLEWWVNTIKSNKRNAGVNPGAAILSRPALDVEPFQVVLQPGDVALVHPLLPHRVGTNISSSIRYSLICRLRCRHEVSSIANMDPDALLAPGGAFGWYTERVQAVTRA